MLKYELWSDFIYGDLCGGRLVAHAISDGFFDTKDDGSGIAGDYLAFVNELLGFQCGHCNDRSSTSVVQLQKHLNILHKKQLCQVCIESGRFFVSELSRFSKNDLKHHIEDGQPKEGRESHPLCHFCKPKRYYDEQQLYYHMIHDHFQCDVCRNIGDGNRFFQKYDNLKEHFHALHYPCEQKECVLNRYVVFESEIALKRHMATNHPQVKFNRSIVVNFTFGRGGGRGGGSSGGSGSSSSGRGGGGGEMTFSDDFMRRGNSNTRRRGRAREENTAINRNDTVSFPTLQETLREHVSHTNGETKETSSSATTTATTAVTAATTAAIAAALGDPTLHAFNTKDEDWLCTVCTMTDEEHLELDGLTFVTEGVQLSCAHGYHTQCLSNWINTSKKNGQTPTCPNCRDEIDHGMCEIVLQRHHKQLRRLKKEQQNRR
jgi:hypothetical protein